MSDVWESKPVIYSPYYTYLTCLVFLLIWSFTENYVAFIVDRNIFQKVVSVFATFTILAVLVGFFAFWQFLRITEGQLDKEDYYFQIGNFQPIERLPRFSELPTWREFLVSERCNKGLAISTMSEIEATELRLKHEQLYMNAFNKKF